MEVDLKKERVFLAMPTHRDIHPHTCVSLLETQQAMLQFGIPHRISMPFADSLPHHARSELVAEFLASESTIMAWCDSDIVWDWRDFFRMCVLAKKRGCVVGAYISRDGTNRFSLNVGGKEEIKSDRDGLIPIDGAGLGFTFVRRDIIKKLSDEAELVQFSSSGEKLPYVFRCDKADVNYVRSARGEDMAFFADVRAAGFEVLLNPDVMLGHVGQTVFKGRALDLLKPVGKGKPDQTG